MNYYSLLSQSPPESSGYAVGIQPYMHGHHLQLVLDTIFSLGVMEAQLVNGRGLWSFQAQMWYTNPDQLMDYIHNRVTHVTKICGLTKQQALETINRLEQMNTLDALRREYP